jgi:hypothetical protein
VVRWLIWISVVIVWTVALEVPVPDPGQGPAGQLVWTNRYTIGKSLHVVAYGLVAVLSARVPLPGRYRWLMMFFLMGHAWGTEMLQEALEPWCHRGGSLVDVGYDILGVMLGVAATWKAWVREC